MQSWRNLSFAVSYKHFDLGQGACGIHHHWRCLLIWGRGLLAYLYRMSLTGSPGREWLCFSSAWKDPMTMSNISFVRLLFPLKNQEAWLWGISRLISLMTSRVSPKQSLSSVVFTEWCLKWEIFLLWLLLGEEHFYGFLTNWSYMKL